MIALAVALAVSFPAADPPYRFALASPVPIAGAVTNSAVAADIDGDGRLDLAAGADRLEVLLQDPADRSKWLAVIDPWPESGLWSLIAADFTGDGRPDIVAAAPGSTALCYRGTGGGHFEKPAAIPSTDGSRTVTAGDFDRDGTLDIASANWNRENLSIHHGLGDGTFRLLVVLPFTDEPHAVRTLDFDGDGIVDLAAGFPASILPLRGGGDGGFVAGRPIDELGGGESLAVADFDRDGKQDLIGQGAVGISRGDGTFKKSISICWSCPFTVGDPDRDGDEDLIFFGGSTFMFARGLGDGTFAPPVSPWPFLAPTGSSIGWMAVEDLDGDGGPDLVFGDPTSVQVLWGSRDAGLLSPGWIPSTSIAGPIAVADLDGSGLPDVFGPKGHDVLVTLDPGRGAAAASTIVVPVDEPIGYLAAVDLEGDGGPDLAILAPADRRAEAFLLGRDGRVRRATALTTGPSPAGLAVGPLLGGPGPDLAIPCSGPAAIWVFGNRGGGDFADAVQVPTIAGPHGPVIADLDLDGRGDLAVWNLNSLAVQFGTGGGAFADPASLDASAPLFAGAAAGDVDGDGVPDVVAIERTSSTVRIYRGNGGRAFGAARTIGLRDKPSSVAVADLDRDGLLDVVAASADGKSVAVILNGPAGLGEPATSTIGMQASWLRLADFDGDGVTDAIISGSNGAAILFGRTAAPPAPRFLRGDATGDRAIDISDPIAILQMLFLGGAALPCAEAADADDDGALDLTDPVALLASLFLGAGPLPAPGPTACGPDPSPDALGCGQGCP